MKGYKWVLYVGLALATASAFTYLAHYLIFDDPHHIFIYLLGDIAFVPLEVFLVVIVIERILSRREKAAMLNKLNMVIGTFFSDVGTQLLGQLTECLKNRQELKKALAIGSGWSGKEFKAALATARSFDYDIDPEQMNLPQWRERLATKRDMLLSLLANPNLLEHDSFTNMLWAVFHLLEELQARDSLDDLPPSDLKHLAGDVKRVYSQLTVEWLEYCEHLRMSYPYIYSIIVRTHPLQEKPSAVVA